MGYLNKQLAAIVIQYIISDKTSLSNNLLMTRIGIKHEVYTVKKGYSFSRDIPAGDGKTNNLFLQCTLF
jgi:hypothetical protein